MFTEYQRGALHWTHIHMTWSSLKVDKEQGLPSSRPPSPKLCPQDVSYSDERYSYVSDFFPGFVWCLEQQEIYARIPGTSLRRADQHRDKRQNLGAWAQRCGSNLKGTLMRTANGAKPKLTELCIPKALVYRVEKRCSVQGNHSLMLWIWPRCWGSLLVCFRSTVT